MHGGVTFSVFNAWMNTVRAVSYCLTAERLTTAENPSHMCLGLHIGPQFRRKILWFVCACLDKLHRLGGASMSAQHDVDLVHRAVVSQWDICAIAEYHPVQTN
jgi:hypothetical protein